MTDQTPPPPGNSLIAAAAGAVRKAVERPLADMELLEFQPDLVALEQRPVPRAAVWTLFTVVGLIVFALTWATVAQVDRVITAEGRLVVTAAKVVVQPLETGVVRSIPVRVGQTVRKGEVVATLDATFTEADATASRNSLTSLDAQVVRLEAEMAGREPPRFSSDGRENALQTDIFQRHKAETAANVASLDAEIASLAAELNTTKREQHDAGKTLDIAREVEDMRSRLVAREAGSRLQLLEAEARRASAERDLNRLSNSAQQIVQKLNAAREKRGAYLSETQSKLAQELQTVRRDRDRVAEELKKQERRYSLVNLTAPVDAVVLEVAPRSIGSVASQAEPLVTLVPVDAPLEAEIEIQPADVAQLRVGQDVRLKLEALPYQRHGVIDGRLQVISGDVLKAEKAPGGQQALVYRSRVAIAEPHLRGVPADFRLIPGMTVSAEIKIGTRRIISYFIYPLFRALDESFREP